MTTTIAGLDAATTALAGAVLGPEQLRTSLAFDPFAVLTDAELDAVRRIPFSDADLRAARERDEMLVLRIPRSPDGPLSMVRLAERLSGGLDPKVHTGVGYMLRDEWTIDTQDFATADVCVAGWYLVRREIDPTTPNLLYREQDTLLAARAAASPRVPPRRSAVEIAWDTLLWQKAHGERLLATTWDWSRSESNDRGLAALGEFGEAGLGVIAYSRAVRFGTLGVCPQR